ncbi:MAG: membrane protein insertion efficiency factor YidD [Pseudomonadales bacterium]|nr:membrane protein insertion efficiency factor YidD [Pseudomonadales bacterium]
MKSLLLLLIKIYQYGISPLLGNNCRFYPSCSSYTKEAIEQHGPLKGMALGGRRILKCHPYHEGGVDLVPEKASKNKHNN